MKSSEVCIKTRSPPASLPIQGQATKHTTVKWPIDLFEKRPCQGAVSFHATSSVFKVQLFDCIIDVAFIRPTIDPLSSFVSLLARVTLFFPSSNINMSNKHAAAFLLRVKLFARDYHASARGGPSRFLLAPSANSSPSLV